MQKYSILLILILFPSVKCWPQSGGTLPVIDKQDLPEAVIAPGRIFTGSSLFGYIDGGAELYLEYGFIEAWVSEIRFMGGKYKTEIYQMQNPDAAFGIFSVSKYRCRNVPADFEFSCQTRYQLQICAGSFYISIINGTGNANDSIASIKIGKAIAGKIGEEPADISGYLPGIQVENIGIRAVLVKGKLGIINGASDWEDYFRNASGYSAVILQEEARTLLSVKFGNEKDLSDFAKLHKWDLHSISENPVKLFGNESVENWAILIS